MANNIFHLPGQPEHAPETTPQFRASPLMEAMSISDTYRYTPENQPEAYRFIYDIAEHIHERRQDGLEAMSSRNKGIFNSFGLWRENPTVEKMIESEHRLVYDNASFWLGPKHDIGQDAREQQGDEVAHWYYHQYVTNGDGTTGEVAIHYETRPTVLFKWVMGRPYPLDLEETGRFCQVVRHYKTKVTELHSPVDANLEMLQEEEEEEKLIDARTNMVMFSKPVTDKMVEDYRQQQLVKTQKAKEEAERLNLQHQQDQQKQQAQVLDSQARFQARRDVSERQNWQDENRRAA